MLVVVPFALICAYELLLATDRYESVASAIITEERAGGTSIDLSFLGVTNAAADRDAYTLKEFVESVDMLKHVDGVLNIREHYSNTNVDFYSRLDAGAAIEDFHEYMLNYITIEFDQEKKILYFAVQAFTAEYAQKLLNAILERSQQFIDQLNEQVNRDQRIFFDKQITQSYARLDKAKQKLLDFQRENKILTVEGDTQTIMSTISGLEQSLAQKRSELNARLKVLSADAPQLTTLQLEIASLATQIASEKERLIGASSSSLSQLGAEFREIQVELEFATEVYKTNLTALEQARVEAARRLKFLIVVANPSQAEKSEYPDRTYITITAAILLLAAYLVISLIISIMREHS